LEERVAAIVPNAKPGFPPLSQCLHLLGGEQQTEDAWYALFHKENLKSSNWDDYAVEVMQTQIQQRFAGSWMDPKKLELSELKNMAVDPNALWGRLKPEGVSFLSPLGKRQHVLEIMEEWISACLIHYGFKASQIPGQALVMTRTDLSVCPTELLASALQGKLSNTDLVQFMPMAPGQE
jgi:hypothetical protein